MQEDIEKNQRKVYKVREFFSQFIHNFWLLYKHTNKRKFLIKERTLTLFHFYSFPADFSAGLLFLNENKNKHALAGVLVFLWKISTSLDYYCQFASFFKLILAKLTVQLRHANLQQILNLDHFVCSISSYAKKGSYSFCDTSYPLSKECLEGQLVKFIINFRFQKIQRNLLGLSKSGKQSCLLFFIHQFRLVIFHHFEKWVIDDSTDKNQYETKDNISPIHT